MRGTGRASGGSPPAQVGGAERSQPPLPFWSESGGLDLASARLVPGGRAVEVRFRGGQVYQVDLGALGFAGPGLLATPAATGHGVMRAISTGGLVEIATSRLLAAAEPAYREALARAAEVPPSVGAVIRARRRAAGFTAMQVAAAAGMARSNYARLEASRHQPRIDTLRRVAAALGVGLGELLGQGS
jgi:DNA-binding phage protein